MLTAWFAADSDPKSGANQACSEPRNKAKGGIRNEKARVSLPGRSGELWITDLRLVTGAAFLIEMDAIYALADPFVGHALRAGLVALVWLIAGGFVVAMRSRFNLPAWPLFTAGGAWALFALLEAEATRERANIRVDLLFTWPALLVISVGCAVVWVVLLCRRSSPA